jgi:sulfate permease, SulP family
VRKGLKPLLRKRAGPARGWPDVLTKAGPVAPWRRDAALVWGLALDQAGVAVVGAVPQSLPPFTLPSFDPDLLRALRCLPALISVIGFVESVSVAQTLAAKSASASTRIRS